MPTDGNTTDTKLCLHFDNADVLTEDDALGGSSKDITMGLSGPAYQAPEVPDTFDASDVPYTPDDPSDWPDPDPTNVQEALDALPDMGGSGSGDVSAADNLTEDEIVLGHADNKKVKTTGKTVTALESATSAAQLTANQAILDAASAQGDIDNHELDTANPHDVEASQVDYTPGTPGDWNAGDPGEVDDALDELASNLSPLLPSAAPVLDDIDCDTGAGVRGRNTWDSSNPISGYRNDDSNFPVDTDINPTGQVKGIYDYDTFTTISGTLNEDVPVDDNYPANAFGPGGADGGSVNDLKLVVNGSTVHTVDLLTFGSGDSKNGNQSGFTNLLDDTPVYFPDTTPFPARTYRTGGWVVHKDDCSKGINEVKIQQTTDAGTVTTDIFYFVLDDSNTATAFGTGSFGTRSGAGTKQLSGVTYWTGTITYPYSITIANAYRNTYVREGTAITFQESACSIANKQLDLSAGDEAKAADIVNRTATISSGIRLIGGNISTSTRVERTVQSDDTSGSASKTGILYDDVSATSTALIEGFDDEDYRLHSGTSWDTDVTSNWDESKSLVGADANYNDGAQVLNSALDYPSQNFGGMAEAPGGNPNYTTATGQRYYYRFFEQASPTTNSFAIKLSGAFTLVSGAPTASTNQIRVRLRWPTQTGWMDLNADFVEGNWNDDDGCHSASLDGEGESGTLGISIGTKSTANSHDKCIIEITVPSGWTGNLTGLRLYWAP